MGGKIICATDFLENTILINRKKWILAYIFIAVNDIAFKIVRFFGCCFSSFTINTTFRMGILWAKSFIIVLFIKESSEFTWQQVHIQ